MAETNYSKCYLTIGIPTIDYIHWTFAKCLTGLTRRLDELGVNYTIVWEAGSLVYISRDKIVKKALARQDTHILWLDSDMVFNPDIFERLYKTMNEQRAYLVTGLYNSRHTNKLPVMWETLKPEVKRMEKYPDEEVFPIEACGFGCCLTRCDMISNVWFHEGTCFLPTHQYGEDIAFCKRAIDVGGYKMVATSRVCCGHVAQRLVWPDERSGDLQKYFWEPIV